MFYRKRFYFSGQTNIMTTNLKSFSIAIAGAACVSLGAFGSPAIALIVTFQGTDPGVGPGGARPSSDLAANNFDIAASDLGSINLIDFEPLPLGNFTSLEVVPGVTVTLSNTQAGSPLGVGITNFIGGTDANSPERIGYNTTADGSQFLRVFPNSSNTNTVIANFSFNTPIQAFGTFITGLSTQIGNLNLVFNDGTSQSLPVVGAPGQTGGVQFFGFTDEEKFITDVSLELQDRSTGLDLFGIDDVRFVASASVPEPSSVMGLLMVSALGTSSLVRHKWKQSLISRIKTRS